jgi:predicted dehydrogenase
MSEPLRLGVVGVGHLGQHHARIYAGMDGVRLVGVADRDPARAHEVAARHGCPAFATAAELAASVDAASVAVPTIEHRAVTECLLAAGADVLVEKPIAAGLDDAEAMIAAARARGRVLMVGHVERFNPAVIALARAVDAPRFLEIHRLAGFSARSTDVDVILDLMIHDLDLLLHLDGTELVSLDAVGVQALTRNVDIANVRIRLASGCVANLTASRISAETVRKVRVFQARTYLACDTVARTVERYQLAFRPDGAPEIRHEGLPVEPGEPLALELEAFVRAVRTRGEPPVPGEQGRSALRLARQVKDAITAATR